MKHVALALGLLACSAPAQTLQLSRTGGTLGRSLVVSVSGTPNHAFLMLPSLNAGPTPLSVLDPRDPRVLEVGLDLLPLMLVGTTQAAPIPVPYPIPGDPAFQGRTLHYHAFTFPGTTFVAGTVSNPVRSTLGAANTWVDRAKVYAEARALAGVGRLPGGRYLLAGGGAGDLLNAKGLATSEIYDADRQTFQKGPNLTTARALMQAVTLKNGKVLIAGGADSLGNPLRTCELYDPSTNTFAPTGSMRVARAAHSATLLPNGNVLVAGGSPNFKDPVQAINNAQRSTEIYNTATGTFSNGPDMSRPRLAHVAIALDNGRVLITGGATYTTFIIKIPGITNTCELYDPGTNRFGGTGSMPSSRAGHALTKLANGDVLVTGGARFVSITDIRVIDNAATYAVASGAWTATANAMSVARAAPTNVRLAGGRVLVAGGVVGSLTAPGATARCEFFDPGTRRFSAAPSLGTARAGAHAFLLPEGQVFASGGGGGSGNQALATGEMLFLP